MGRWCGGGIGWEDRACDGLFLCCWIGIRMVQTGWIKERGGEGVVWMEVRYLGEREVDLGVRDWIQRYCVIHTTYTSCQWERNLLFDRQMEIGRFRFLPVEDIELLLLSFFSASSDQHQDATQNSNINPLPSSFPLQHPLPQNLCLARNTQNCVTLTMLCAKAPQNDHLRLRLPLLHNITTNTTAQHLRLGKLPNSSSPLGLVLSLPRTRRFASIRTVDSREIGGTLARPFTPLPPPPTLPPPPLRWEKCVCAMESS